MPKLFHLSCSPRADSESSAGAKVFIDRFRQARPDWDIDVMNLWRDHLPEFEGYVLEAKYARIGGRPFTDSQRDAFAVTERIALRFALADRVLISTPMWNFGIPYKTETMDRRHHPARAGVPLRSGARLSAAVQGQADGRDPGERQRFHHRHESRPHRHGDPLSARGAPLHRRQRRAFRADRTDHRAARTDPHRTRRRASAAGRDGRAILILESKPWRNRNICGNMALTRLRRRRTPLKCYELQGPSGIDGLALVDKPVPEPGEGEVLVRLKAATLNYRDLLTVKGGYGSRQKFPLVPVSDGAGVVERVGPGVREFAAGDRVIGSFFESWIGGEPSEAKMRANLGGAVDGVLTRISDLSEARAGQNAGAPQRHRSRSTSLRRAHGLECGHKTRRRETRPDRSDARHRRGISLRTSVCQNVRRARHGDLVERREDRTPQAARRRLYIELQGDTRLGKESPRVERPRRRPGRRGGRGRYAERIDPGDQDRRHDRVHRRARRAAAVQLAAAADGHAAAAAARCHRRIGRGPQGDGGCALRQVA